MVVKVPSPISMSAEGCLGVEAVRALLSKYSGNEVTVDDAFAVLAASAVVFVGLLIALLYYMQHRHKLLSDARLGLNFLYVVNRLKLTGKTMRRTFVNSFNDAVKAWPNKVAVEYVDDGRKYTFKEIDQMANKWANLFSSQGLKKGDVAAIFMVNKPEYIMIELALAKLGVVSALFNYNLKGKPLSHSIGIADAKLIVFDADLAPALDEIKGEHPGLKMLSVGAAGKALKFATWVDELVQAQDNTPPDPKIIEDIQQDDILSLVYTSGTTGLPKAAIIKHKRIYLTSVGFAKMFNIKFSDRIYCTLPLYHSAGGNIGLGMTINIGSTLIIRSKFSARGFFKDVHDYNATVTQYIGELCRYLVHSPESKFDRDHNLRLAFGNGLRKDVWMEFVNRFHVNEIGEFYGATEGNIGFWNYWKKGEPHGAIGKGGFLNRMAMGWTLVKFDDIKEEPARDANGRCIPCKDGETGELIAIIKGTSEFVGYYKNKDATDKKVLKDAFKKGDTWFRSGDLLMVDRQSYIFFMDRIGDTFRWKGENVSTSEVALALSPCEDLDEINVVGVEVPGKDGRACMAAVTLVEGRTEINWSRFYEVAKGTLPAYAVPLFVRVLPKQETTGTFKHMKNTYRTEGINLSVVKDPLYWLNPATRAYEPFTEKCYKAIQTGEAKV